MKRWILALLMGLALMAPLGACAPQDRTVVVPATGQVYTTKGPDAQICDPETKKCQGAYEVPSGIAAGALTGTNPWFRPQVNAWGVPINPPCGICGVGAPGGGTTVVVHVRL